MQYGRYLLQIETFGQGVIRHIEGVLRTPKHVHVGKAGA